MIDWLIDWLILHLLSFIQQAGKTAASSIKTFIILTG